MLHVVIGEIGPGLSTHRALHSGVDALRALADSHLFEQIRVVLEARLALVVVGRWQSDLFHAFYACVMAAWPGRAPVAVV